MSWDKQTPLPYGFKPQWGRGYVCITGEKILMPGPGIEPGLLDSVLLYHVAIKAGLYHKAVQVSYIPISSDILLQIEIRP